MENTGTLCDNRHFGSPWWRSIRIVGPGALVAVGYIDPGNWATGLAGGSTAGYALLFVVLMSSIIAMLLQIMCARLGIATGMDLAQASREAWPRFALPGWIVAELAIIATDLAEVLGAAIALQLLFGMPIALGVILTTMDVLLLLALERWGSSLLERLVASFLFLIAAGFAYELILARPAFYDVLHGFLPSRTLIQDSGILYLAIGIVGATVMPHNLYLHSSLVIPQASGTNKQKAAWLASLNTIISLACALVLNAALVILAASTFHHASITDVADLSTAHGLLAPLLGTGMAATVFAIMLLLSGQSATITGTMAGQVVMSGFVRMQMKPWKRRLLTRTLALFPALLTIYWFGESSITWLLVSSQVFLSFQLPFAMLSLLMLSSNKSRMGELVNTRSMQWFGWISAVIILAANAILIKEIVCAG